MLSPVPRSGVGWVPGTPGSLGVGARGSRSRGAVPGTVASLTRSFGVQRKGAPISDARRVPSVAPSQHAFSLDPRAFLADPSAFLPPAPDGGSAAVAEAR